MKGQPSIPVPHGFCWSRYGTEAGETTESILARKEEERRVNHGQFLWGVGNSVGSALAVLARDVSDPEVLFSPIRSKPRAVDVKPSRIVIWQTAEHPDGSRHPIPPSMMVRGRASVGGRLAAHFALVCHSEVELQPADRGEIAMQSVVNYMSGRGVGASQVTAVVRTVQGDDSTGKVYPVTMRARLLAPYCVRLRDPIEVEALDAHPVTHDALLGVA